jgi:TM2 domain-containing membrane protein YozV
MTLVGIPGVALVIAGIERFTHNDVLAAFATLLIMGTYLGWWFWRHRYL